MLLPCGVAAGLERRQRRGCGREVIEGEIAARTVRYGTQDGNRNGASTSQASFPVGYYTAFARISAFEGTHVGNMVRL